MTARTCPGPLACLVALALLLAAPVGASADITGFLGTSLAPAGRLARGLAAGSGLVVVGFEFEVAHIAEASDTGEPGLTTGMASVLLQTPLEVSRTQFYATSGVGLYRERLGERQETSVLGALGGGVKVRLTGPLKLRLDYRLLRLRGAPLRETTHRVYAGATLGF